MPELLGTFLRNNFSIIQRLLRKAPKHLYYIRHLFLAPSPLLCTGFIKNDIFYKEKGKKKLPPPTSPKHPCRRHIFITTKYYNYISF